MLKTITGREAVFLRDRVDVLKLRLLAVKSKQCATKKNKYHCPEVFLDAVADKLTTTADLFLDAELLSKFYYIVSLQSHQRGKLPERDLLTCSLVPS
jgi:replication fork clamp-binding protein CrfC